MTDLLFSSGSVSYVHPLTLRLSPGISAQNNFGLALDWSSQRVGRKQTVNEWLNVYQVQPTLAWKVNDWPSAGGGNAFAGNVQGQYQNACFVFASVHASWKFW